MQSVVHFEVPVDDMSRAKNFYQSVFQWKLDDFDENYTIAGTTEVDQNRRPVQPGAINGGLFPRNGGGSQAPVITINVPSIDNHLTQIEQAGGKVVQPKAEIPDMGYYAYFLDTEGNVLGLWENLK